MINASFAKIAAGSLILGTALAGGGPIGEHFSFASAQSSSSQAGAALSAAKQARKALAKGQTEKAIAFAERSVALAPNDPATRMLLGEAYLAAGRFVSAGTSYSDVLDLSPANERAALRLALTDIALGHVEKAQLLLQDNKQNLSAADYGLALALSGDHSGAIAALEEAVRAGQSDARTRQNLALSYALDGRWVQARALAAQDLSPHLLDGRMTQWASLARPKASWDQVAGILGVAPVEDAGQPAQLALNGVTRASQMAATTAAQPVVVAAAEMPASTAPTALFEVGGSSPQPVQEEVAARSQLSTIEFASRQEIVQAIPEGQAVRAAQAPRTPRAVPLVRAQNTPIKTAAVSPKAHPSSIKPGQRAMIIETVSPRNSVASGKSNAKPVAAKPILTASAAAKLPKSVQTIVAPKSGKSMASGQFLVQLGAFASKAAVESAWAAASGKVGNRSAVTSQVTTNGKTFQRLALSGYSSAADAQQACSKVKAAGGQCFVKNAASESTRWASLSPSKVVRIASR